MTELHTGAIRDVVMTADVVVCSVPLPRPIRLGAMEIQAREYCVLRLTTESGIVGTALGYTRGLPVADALERASATVVGLDIGDAEATEPESGAVEIRARGLVEIALLDARARSAKQPLWRLLGGERARVPLLAVGGYFMDARSLEDVAAELRQLAADGFRRLKVHATERAAIEHLRQAVGAEARLAVDLHGACGTLEDALDLCLPLDDLDLDFIEDPFPPDHSHLLGELAARLRTPLAAGEDVPGAAALRDLIPGVSILRVDATSSGGITAVLEAADAAAAAGHEVMTHAFPDFHGHLAGGKPSIETVEMIPYASGANPVDVLMAGRQAVDDGALVLSEEPGHGMPLDWDAVLHHATRHATLRTDDLGGAA